jgi:hypothetical protein
MSVSTRSSAGQIAADIPSSEINQLQALAAQGLLNGVPPSVLAAQVQAESGGTGGFVNGAGYGGYFGLSAGTPYGASGAAVTSAELTGTSPSGFDTQAETAAAEDASLLARYGGSTTEMERAYQGGGGEGTAVFASDHVPTSVPVATLTGLNWNPGDGFGIPGTIGGAVGSAAGAAVSGLGSAILHDLGPLMLKVVFVVAGLGLVVLGISRMFPGVTRTVTSASGGGGAGAPDLSTVAALAAA